MSNRVKLNKQQEINMSEAKTVEALKRLDDALTAARQVTEQLTDALADANVLDIGLGLVTQSAAAAMALNVTATYAGLQTAGLLKHMDKQIDLIETPNKEIILP